MPHLLAQLLAVIPWYHVPDLNIPFPVIASGHIPIHPFGVLVATGIVVGHHIATKRAKTLGLDPQRFESLVFWTVFGGIVISHMFDTVAYHPETLRENPLELFMIPHGLSSFGGFFGAAICFLTYSSRNHIDRLRAADAICLGLPVGWLFGRTGCSVVHDHPGAPSTSFIAVDYQHMGALDGPRFDLGLTELMFVPLMILTVWIVSRITTKRGAVTAALALVYPPIRFPLDYLRLDDAHGGDLRYGPFTPGQYSCVLMFAIGLYLAYLASQDKSAPPVPYTAPVAPTASPSAGSTASTTPPR